MKDNTAPHEYWNKYSEEDILEANRIKYNDENILKFYKDYEEPVYSYLEYDVVLGTVLDVLNRTTETVKAVDLCGGAGKAAFVVRKLDKNARVLLVDLAKKMLDIARSRMAFENISDIEIIEADAFSFLQQEQEFDLIIFSSAVHHFKDPVNLLHTAANRLSSHGFIVTLADPTTLIKTKRYNIFNFLITGWDNKKRMIGQSWEKYVRSRNSEVAASSEIEFDIAEFQTYMGINDQKLKHDLAQVGVKPLLHMRYPAGGKPFITKLMGIVGISWAYGMVLYRDEGQDYNHIQKEVKAYIKNRLPFKITFLD
jgi:SAM-dependent methyltransferase